MGKVCTYVFVPKAIPNPRGWGGVSLLSMYIMLADLTGLGESSYIPGYGLLS